MFALVATPSRLDRPASGPNPTELRNITWNAATVWADIKSRLCNANGSSLRYPSACQPPGFFNVSMIWSTLKLDGVCRGGNSLNVAMNCATTACAGTAKNECCKIQSL